MCFTSSNFSVQSLIVLRRSGTVLLVAFMFETYFHMVGHNGYPMIIVYNDVVHDANPISLNQVIFRCTFRVIC